MRDYLVNFTGVSAALEVLAGLGEGWDRSRNELSEENRCSTG